MGKCADITSEMDGALTPKSRETSAQIRKNVTIFRGRRTRLRTTAILNPGTACTARSTNGSSVQGRRTVKHMRIMLRVSRIISKPRKTLYNVATKEETTLWHTWGGEVRAVSCTLRRLACIPSYIRDKHHAGTSPEPWHDDSLKPL